MCPLVTGNANVHEQADCPRFRADNGDSRKTPPYGVRKWDMPKNTTLLPIFLKSERLKSGYPLYQLDCVLRRHSHASLTPIIASARILGHFTRFTLQLFSFPQFLADSFDSASQKFEEGFKGQLVWSLATKPPILPSYCRDGSCRRREYMRARCTPSITESNHSIHLAFIPACFAACRRG